MLDSRVLSIRIPPGVTKGGVGRDAGRNGLRDQLPDSVRVLPGNVPEVVVEGLEDVGQPIQFRLGSVPSPGGGHGIDFGVRVGQQDLLHLLLLHPVAVQVDGVKDAL